MKLSLESLLAQLFPVDTVMPVPKGVHGGDVIHSVYDNSGRLCGTLLWETKRTKNWNDAWLPKLRDDHRAAKAQIAILVSVELPKGITTFAQIDGVWVTSRACATGLAHALRLGLIELAKVQASQEGRQEKMAVLYGYLSSTEFQMRIEGIVEAFKTLREELEKEKRAINAQWARREKQLQRALISTTGLYGDLAGILGSSLPAVQLLQLEPATEPQVEIEGA